jgi:cytochrome c biogenesis protein CcmG/thiol:disulfide interchange protein DsbE
MTQRGTWIAYAALPLAVLIFSGVGLWLSGGVIRPAAEFTLPIAAGDGAAHGDRVSLEQLRGRIVLLDFWASWCGPCAQSIPILNRIQTDFAGEPVTVLGVNVEPELSARQLAAAHDAFGTEFPSVRDDGGLEEAYGVTSLPTLIVIDGEGQVREIRAGVPDEQRLRALITDLLRGGQSAN